MKSYKPILWGRLFPFSPIIIGFEKKEFNKAIIYYRAGTDITKLFIIDKFINEVEDFHQLKFMKEVKIFIFNSNMVVGRYYTKEEVFAKIRKGYFFNPDDWGTLGKRKKMFLNFKCLISIGLFILSLHV